MLHSRIAHQCGTTLPGKIAASQTCLGTDSRVVTHFQVSCYAHLTCKHAPFAHFRTASHTHLRRHDRVLSHFHIVRNLYEVVKFHTLADDGAAHRRAVNTCVGTNLHIVLDGHDANLRNLFVAFGRRCKAETVGTNHTTSVQDAVVAHFAVVINHRIAVNLRVVAHLRIRTNRGMRMNHHAVAYLHILTNRHKRTNVAVLANLCRLVNECQRINAHTFLLHALIKLQQFCH